MISTGWSQLWESMCQKDNLNIKLNVNVTSINRSLNSPDSPIIVKANTPNNQETFECDFLIITSPLSHCVEFLSDATDEEKEILGNIHTFTLTTTLVESPGKENNAFGKLYPFNLTVENSGQPYTSRDSYQAVTGEHPKDPSKKLEVVYQFLPDYKPGREEELKSKVIEHLITYNSPKITLSDISIIKQCVWDYFGHYPQEYLNKLYPWKLYDMQGKYRTFYSGGHACFESVEDIISYNYLLLNNKNST